MNPASEPMIVVGSPASPYTRKLAAALRYRRLPFQLVQARSPLAEALPAPRVRLFPTVYLPRDGGWSDPLTDSTPILRLLENAHPGRPLIPADPATAFLNDLIEDYADEWMTKPMFHYRWTGAADIAKAGLVIMAMGNRALPEAELRATADQFAARQIGRLGFVGSNAVTGPVIEAAYGRLLAAFETLLAARPFLFGAAPASADFALFGQLSQLCGFDPTPMALSAALAPRVVAWTFTTEDLSGLDAPPEAAAPLADIVGDLAPLLAEIGRTYAPVMIANAQALLSGATEVRTRVDGRDWVQAPFPYQGKTLGWLRAAHAALSEQDRIALKPVLEGAGLTELIS